MIVILICLAQTLGVILLALLGFLISSRFARIRGRSWITGYLVALPILGMMALPRWFPLLTATVPFRWLMADRSEYAIAALLCTVLIGTPMLRLENERRRVFPAIFMIFFVIYFSLTPFIVPAFSYRTLSTLTTTMDINRVCMQSNNYTCGPAAAVTALRRMGLPAEEGVLAIRAHTTWFAGTPPDALTQAIEKEYAVPCCIRYAKDVMELAEHAPFIAVMKYQFLVDHYVAVLEVNDNTIMIGDPLTGLQSLSHEEFRNQWRHSAVLINKD